MHIQPVRTYSIVKPFQLREAFVRPYHNKGDAFKSLLARSTYLTKYCRGGETWTDTIRRVVEGNCSVGQVTMDEAEELFHAFWTLQALPPGRGLWTGGVLGIPADASFNCWYVTIEGIDDWCWTANMLMLGGGVGVGLQEIGTLPAVEPANARFAVWCREDHPDLLEFTTDPKSFLNGQTPTFLVPDSREGWVEALRKTLESAWTGQDLIVDVSAVRPRGQPLRTFGGIACGPGPLVELLRSVWTIVRGAAGRRLTSIECLDVTNFIGKCVKSGNIRRSALIVLGEAGNQYFRDAKKDQQAVMSHRHTSNNSIIFRTKGELNSFDWHSLVADNVNFGEPGILNLAKIWKTDPGAKGINPCLTGDTRVSTQLGMVKIADLAAKRTPLNVTTDARVQTGYGVLMETKGTVVREAIPAFQTSPSEEVFRVTTRHGLQVKATTGHKFPTPRGFVELRDLDLGDELLLQSGEGQWGRDGDGSVGEDIGRQMSGGYHRPSDKMVPEVIWSGTKECVVGFLRGLFAEETRYGTSVRLTREPPRFLGEVQRLLLNLGVVSSLYRRSDEEADLVISGQNFAVFGRQTGLARTNGSHHREYFTDTIVSIESIGREPTFCTTQPSHHTFIADGIVSGNCGEIPLHDREACNLAEVYPSNFERNTDPDRIFQLVTRYCLRQRLNSLTDPKSDLVNRTNMRLGVGLGGICDFLWDEDKLKGWYKVCRREANRYAKELGVPRPIAVTTVKPSGTTSLLASSSPGVHAPFAPFYIRRVRIASNDPMAPAMRAAGVTSEPCQYDSTGRTDVFSFPIRATHTRITVQGETVRDQFERQLAVQQAWSDNAVSATISFSKHEGYEEELASLLQEFVPQLKSTSLLAKDHAYPQAPYEAIDEEAYEALAETIDLDSKLVFGGEMEIEL